MNKEMIGLTSSPVDVLTGPIEDIIKTEDGRYTAKQAAAVIFASTHIANGVPLVDVEASVRKIFELTTRNKIGNALENARSLIQTEQ